ncbi:hypothetical protein QBC37DRAFT_427321 [Rhypophila decipiens]|uniref:Transmembrane protein n=1 Tax=Rhypophila decipiens TaxID=261697 RepID=A0AAN6Y6V5_9PEZI|nr:hypothetical protein QBC37DRAFT_427321 [Rhypophila decipiens]
MRQTLRSPAPQGSSISGHELRAARPAAPGNPIVESWLESIHPSPSTATTVTTTAAHDSLHHGSSPKYNFVSNGTHLLPNASDRDRRWLVIRSGLRATSLMFALTVMILIFCLNEYKFGLDPVWIPVLTLCSIAMLCNGLDLAVAAIRRGRGIPNNIHAFTDCSIAIGIAISVALVIVQIVDWGRQRFSSQYSGPYRIAVASILILTMAIHICLFFSYFNDVRPSRRSNEMHMPRIMVLPSGAAVMVATRSIPRNQAGSRPPPVEMNVLGPGSAPSSTNQAGRQQSMDSSRMAQPTILAISRIAPVINTGSPNTTPLTRPAPVFEGTWPLRQAVPRRKPVATQAIITGSAQTASPIQPQTMIIQARNQHGIPPPGSDYQPDEAELQRAARGEAQAQWIPPHLVALQRADNRPETSGGGSQSPEQV